MYNSIYLKRIIVLLSIFFIHFYFLLLATNNPKDSDLKSQKQFSTLLGTTYALAYADFNADFKLDTEDFALWFLYLNGGLDSILPPHIDPLSEVIANMDHTDEYVHWIETQGYIYDFSEHNYEIPGWPVLAHPDSMIVLDSTMAAQAASHFDSIVIRWPHLANKLEPVKRQLGLTDLPPVKINPDLNQDGVTNLLDLAWFYTLMADSLPVLPDTLERVRNLDYNGDGQTNFLDTEAFLWRLISDENSLTLRRRHNNEDIPVTSGPFNLPDGTAIPEFSDSAKAYAIRNMAWVAYMNHNLLVRAHHDLGLPEPPIAGAPGDMDSDFDRDVTDAMAFFDSLAALLTDNGYAPTCDLNFDARCDSSDIEQFLFFLYYHNTPAEVDFNTLPARWSAEAKSLALFSLDSLASLHPEWSTWRDPENFATKLRNILLPAPITPPFRMDIDGNGRVDLADAVMISLGGWRGDPNSDRNGDGVYKINDLVLFVIQMRERQDDNALFAGVSPPTEFSLTLSSAEKSRLLEEFSSAGLTEEEITELETMLSEGVALPKATVISLAQNYPNPFNPSTSISFTVPPGGTKIKLSVFDIRGSLVRVLADGKLEEGTHTVYWDGKNQFGRDVASGVYFSRLIADGKSLTRKMVLLK